MNILDQPWPSECIVPPGPLGELEAYAKQRLGMVPEALPYLTHAPWVARGMVAAGSCKPAVISTRLNLLAHLIVAQDNSCRHCYGAMRSLVRLTGMSEQDVQQVETDLQLARLSPADKLALDFVRRVSRSNPRPSGTALSDLLAVGFSEEAVKEIAGMAGMYVAAVRVPTPLGMPDSELRGLEKTLLGRLAAPFLKMFIRRLFRPEKLGPAPTYSGPFASVVEAFAPTPVQHTWAELLELAFGPTRLTARARALVFAVVARALSAGPMQAESGALARKEGLSEAGLEEALAHLGGKELDPVELAALPYARESVRYRPSEIQERARTLRDAVGPELMLEVVFLCALANGLFRSAVLLERA